MAWPTFGMNVCRVHGGVGKHTEEKRAKGKAEKAMKKAKITFGSPIEVDPHQALLDEVHRTAGHVAWLASMVAALEEEEVVWGLSEKASIGAAEFPGINTKEMAKPSMWVELYQRERAHLLKAAKACIDAGIEERRVHLVEQQGAIVANAMQQLINGMHKMIAEVIGEFVETTHDLDMAIAGVFRDRAPELARTAILEAVVVEEDEQ